MPPKPWRGDRTSHNPVPDSSAAPTALSRSNKSAPDMLVTTVTPILSPPGAPASSLAARPTLPPLSQLQSRNPGPLPPLNLSVRYPIITSASSTEYVRPSLPTDPHQPQSLQSIGPERLTPDVVRQSRGGYQLITPRQDLSNFSGLRSRSSNSLKRALEASPELAARPTFGLMTPSTTQGDSSDVKGLPLPTSSGVASVDSSQYATAPAFSMRTSRPTFSPGQSESSSSTQSTRYSLHIRQQPRAARAGPDGKDRRPIDPPPVLQLMITDFDPNSERDMAELRSTFWVVHCRLVSVLSPRKDMSTLASISESGAREIQRLLLGTAVASPFLCEDDPDIETMPTHPTTEILNDPPSPSSRFIFGSSASRSEQKGKETATTPQSNILACFFIFADLSVRKAGEYRLEFSLMKVEATVLTSGSTLPILHTVTSQVFKVVNAKDFDQVQPSTNLVRGLLDRGAGFPLKLKKGTREGQRRREPGGRSEGGDDDDSEEDEEEP